MALKLVKVLISDAVDASCRRILESSGIAVDYKPGMSKEELIAAIKVERGGSNAVLHARKIFVQATSSKTIDKLCVCVCVCVWG